jgi:2-phospho-L-lactate guanylyltransferase (CobY/MobA/RfbA family)
MAEAFKNAKLKIQNTLTDVYTCPSATTAIVIGCQVANVSAAAEEVEVLWTDASDSNTATRLVKDVIIPAQSSLAVIAGKLVLEAGDKIRAVGETNDDAEIVVSVLEIS